jgi:hypothetical protein
VKRWTSQLPKHQFSDIGVLYPFGGGTGSPFFIIFRRKTHEEDCFSVAGSGYDAVSGSLRRFQAR